MVPPKLVHSSSALTLKHSCKFKTPTARLNLLLPPGTGYIAKALSLRWFKACPETLIHCNRRARLFVVPYEV